MWNCRVAVGSKIDMLNQMVIDKCVGCDTMVSRYNRNVDVNSDADIEYQSKKAGRFSLRPALKLIAIGRGERI
jgi:hypothetical protein